MTSELAYPAQKEFSFLQTVVNEELGHRHERKDSEDNGTGVNTTSLKMSTFGLADRSGTVKTEQREEKLREHSGKDHNSNTVWEDFLTDEEVKEKKKRKEAKREVADDIKFPNLGQSEKQRETVADMSNTEEKEDKDGRHDDLTGKNVTKKKKKKRVFKQVAPATHPTAPSGTSGSQPNLSGHGNTKHESHRLDTMSETGGRHGRKLGRRQRVSPVRRPLMSEQMLQQKIQELHALMVKPLIEPVQYLHQTRQELLRLQGFSQHQAGQFMGSSTLHQAGQFMGSSTLHQPGQFMGSFTQQQSRTHVRQHPFGDLTSDNSDDGYSVLRSAQLHWAKPQRPWTSGPVRAPPHVGKLHRGRPYSAEHQVGSTNPDIDRITNHGPGISANGPRWRGHGSKSRSHIKADRDPSSSVTDVSSGRNQHCVRDHVDKHQLPNTSRSRSTSPAKEIQHADTHLKGSHNPALRKWLKQKNKELRRQKAEERKRLREERAKKQEDVRARQEMFKDSEMKVQEWMAQKRKEAQRKAKEERREMKENNKVRIEREHQRQVQGILRTRSLEHLSTHTEADRKPFVPVIRPATVQGETSPDREQTGHSDQPSVSKFVYKRPVSGHVRLMKLQQQQKYESKKSEEEKKSFEKKLAEEKSKKMRMSYDQWLLKKREEDYSRRQETAKQKALATSDPELERILPELARRRIENIQRGRKRVDTGLNNLNNNVNTSTSRDQIVPETQENMVPDKTSDNMKVSGQRQVLRQRPSTAKFPFNPQESKSPRRPMSAHLPTGSALDASNSEASQPKPFRLPFPPHQGAPRHVLHTQNKLFSPHITSSMSQSPGVPQEDTQVASNAAQECDETLHQTVLQTGQHTVCEVQHHTGLDPDRNQVTTPDPQEADDSFFVTHGNLGEVKDSEADLNQAELGQKMTQLPEVDHWKKLVDELDVSNPENVEHSPTDRDHQESDVTGCMDDEQTNNTERVTCEHDVTEDRTSSSTPDSSTQDRHELNSEDKHTRQHKADMPGMKEYGAVLEKSAPVANLELSGNSAPRKHVSFQPEHVVHEVCGLSEASETDKEGNLLPGIENNDESESKDEEKVSLDNEENDDGEDKSDHRKEQTLQEDVDGSFSSSTSDLFPCEDLVQELLDVPGATDITTDMTRDNTDSEM